MPGLRIATASGNWSSASTWADGLFPGPGDIVCANNFTVTIDQDINVGRITTAAVGTIPATPQMSNYTTPTGTVIYSTDQANNQAWKAFDRNESIQAGGWYASLSSGFLGYIFPTSRIIDRYRLILRNDGYDPNNWTFQASNDGITWTTLHTITSYAGGSYTSPVLGNTTAYTHYRINVTSTRVGNHIIIVEFFLLEKDYTTLSGSAGGGFILSGSYNLTLTDSTSIQAGTTNCLTFSGASPVSASINAVNITNTSNAYGINHSSTGRLNIVGNITGAAGATTGGGLAVNGAGIINIVGNIITTNYTYTLVINAGATVNITGDILFNSAAGGGEGIRVSNSAAVLNITGNVYGQTLNANSSVTINILSNGVTVNITGIVYPVIFNVPPSQTIRSLVVSYLKIVGPIIGCDGNGTITTISSTNASAINIFTGPFICGNYGMTPFLVGRMHLKPTANSYFLFRDNSTNGALSPGAVAPTAYLYSPSTVVNGPSQNDVRFGTVYASGSQTGQMRVPLPSQVSLSIPVDNTTGSAVLTGADIANSVWNKLTSEITASNSIGVRLKNVSTPAITGAQLTALG